MAPPNDEDSMMAENQAAIRSFLKHDYIGNTFSVSHIKMRQTRIIDRLRQMGWRPPAIRSSFHASWSTLDQGRRSAACLYEQYRLRLLTLTLVADFMDSVEGDSYFVTIAAPQWQVAHDRLHYVDVAPIHRKIREGVSILRQDDVKPVIFGMIEVSGGMDLDNTFVWEPHVHFIVIGATKKQLKAAFRVRTAKAQRRSKWLRIDIAREGHILGYPAKFEPELRKMYVGADGRKRRSSDHLKSVNFDSWVEWLANLKITDLIVHHGLGRGITDLLVSCELATLVEEIV